MTARLRIIGSSRPRTLDAVRNGCRTTKDVADYLGIAEGTARNNLNFWAKHGRVRKTSKRVHQIGISCPMKVWELVS